MVDGPDASALLLTLSGRMAIAGWVGSRWAAWSAAGAGGSLSGRRTAYLDCAATPDVDRELSAILRAAPEILFVDHADLVPLATFTGRPGVRRSSSAYATGRGSTSSARNCSSCKPPS